MDTQPFLAGEAEVREVRRAGPTGVRVGKEEPKAGQNLEMPTM